MWGLICLKRVCFITLMSVGCLILFTIKSSYATVISMNETVNHKSLNVCSDPHNLPFSNKKEQGFENKIATLISEELKVPLHYLWYPQNIRFIRKTLRARKCDLVIGTVTGNEMLQNSNPYYRSTYVLVYRANSKYKLSSLRDEQLKNLKIGVILGTPPIRAFAENGLLGNMVAYKGLVDRRFLDAPVKSIINDIAAGKIQVGVVWGPLAGYYVKTAKVPLTMVPLDSKHEGVRLDYWVTMGVRHNEPQWKHRINDILQQLKPKIYSILQAYNVPLLDTTGHLINASQFPLNTTFSRKQ